MFNVLCKENPATNRTATGAFFWYSIRAHVNKPNTYLSEELLPTRIAQYLVLKARACKCYFP